MSRIKILHISASGNIGGTERMLMYSIPHYDCTKFEMRIVSLVDSIHTIDMWMKAGIDVLNLKSPGKKFSFKSWWRLRKAILEWKPDIVFAYGHRASLLGKLVKLTSLYRFKLIFGHRGAGNYRSRFDTFIERCLKFLTDLYICNSDAGAEFLKKKVRVAGNRLMAIPNGIDFVVQENDAKRGDILRKEYLIPDNAVVIGSVGRLSPIKGHEFLIRAIPKIAESVPNLFLVLVGEDHGEGYLQGVVAELGIENRVCFVGLSDEISAWHQIMDVFVLPSLSEGMSVAAIEAMFSGLPIVATNVGGNPEVIVDNQTGILVSAGDSEALADAIVRLCHDSELRNIMSVAGKERAHNCFTLSQMIRKYESVFENLCSTMN